MAKHVKNRSHLSNVEIIEVNDYLRTVLTTEVIDGTKFASYQHSLTDQTVVTHLSKTIPHITKSHVVGLRIKLYGELKRAPAQVGGGKPNRQWEERLVVVHKEVVELRGALAHLEDWIVHNFGTDTFKPLLPRG